jgi:hypothetical protein
VALLLLTTLLATALRADGPSGFRDRAWGTPWNDDAIRSLVGCAGQGEVVTDIEGVIARVAQPECVGYRFSEQLTVNLILLYPEIRWHRLDRARAVLRMLLSDAEMWRLEREVAGELEAWSVQLGWLAAARTAYGEDGPVFRDMAAVFDLADSMRGLQGYQLNFPRKQYAAVRSTLVRQFGPPARERIESRDDAVDDAGVVEVLEWDWDRTVAVMRESGDAATSGYFVIVTRDYRDLITEYERAAARRRADGEVTQPVLWRNPSSYRWFLQVLESFNWAKSP